MPEMTVSQDESNLPTILAKYELKDIYKANEFGPFCQALPDSLCTPKVSVAVYSGGKHSKVSLTRLAAGNPIGEINQKVCQTKLFQSSIKYSNLVHFLAQAQKTPKKQKKQKTDSPPKKFLIFPHTGDGTLQL